MKKDKYETNQLHRLNIPGLDTRLIKRYWDLVMAHINGPSAVAAGIKVLPKANQVFAQTQALWRFLSNDQIKLTGLATPLLELAHEGSRDSCDDYVLVAHDWSCINYSQHHAKTDRLQVPHDCAMGYELQSSLLISDRDGAPICTPALNLATNKGVLSTRTDEPLESQKHLDELTQRIAWLQAQDFAKPLVHIVDREADSAAHLRQWHAGQHRYLVRVNAGSLAQHEGQSKPLRLIAQQLSFHETRQVDHKGKPAIQWLAETDVVLTQPGASLALRLIVTRIIGPEGELLAEWYLLSNLEASVQPERLALWYYWRWRIESYFKLLKEAGQEPESWQQESGAPIFKRLLIASQACAMVWRLLRVQGELPSKRC
ncbi:transposase [Pseudomonas sp. R5(2019)]|uniref:transposase n=1 Tax=Pseudomonas sp. R5(2019) TaxID=2697566 RepID=UPI0014128014|nr:transposase [Pseudomonas sp. R5(2019)]NBA93878.1 transposase [Pseudomonas sp. R5(2019)]